MSWAKQDCAGERCKQQSVQGTQCAVWGNAFRPIGLLRSQCFEHAFNQCNYLTQQGFSMQAPAPPDPPHVTLQTFLVSVLTLADQAVADIGSVNGILDTMSTILAVDVDPNGIAADVTV